MKRLLIVAALLLGAAASPAWRAPRARTPPLPTDSTPQRDDHGHRQRNRDLDADSGEPLVRGADAGADREGGTCRRTRLRCER